MPRKDKLEGPGLGEPATINVPDRNYPMTPPNKDSVVEKVSRAIYDAFDAETEYVGKYEAMFGSTVLDGDFDLESAARAAIKALLMEIDLWAKQTISDEMDRMSEQWAVTNALENFAHSLGITLEEGDG